jgi:RimJ/RimL family protein N-acetyltransferase
MQPTVRLVPFTAAHVPAFTPMTADPDVLRYTRFPDPPEPGFPREWLARYDAGRAIGTKEAFAIVEGDGDDALLGVALAVEIDRAAGAAELGYLVAPAARGRGVATAAVRRLTRWALDEGLTDLTLLIEDDAELRPGRRGAMAVYVFSSEDSGAPQDSRSSGGGTL